MLEAVYMSSNVVICLAYLTIAAMLLHVAFLSRGDRPVLMLHLMFAAFILVCGIGHLEAPVAFVWPQYPAFAAWDALSALVSWLAALVCLRYRARVTLKV